MHVSYDFETDSLIEMYITCGCGRHAIELAPDVLGCSHCDSVCYDADCKDCVEFRRR